MNQKQKLKDPQILFFLSILLIVSLCFILLVPKVASRVFPQKREMLLNAFITQVKRDQKIDPQKYWEFREFYSPGYFNFSEKGIDMSNLKDGHSDLSRSADMIDLYFLGFYSKNLISLDGLTEEASLNKVFYKDKLSTKEVLFESHNAIIYKDTTGQTYIVFLLPISEMKKANGFFDYNKNELKFLDKKNWFNITKLKK